MQPNVPCCCSGAPQQKSTCTFEWRVVLSLAEKCFASTTVLEGQEDRISISSKCFSCGSYQSFHFMYMCICLESELVWLLSIQLLPFWWSDIFFIVEELPSKPDACYQRATTLGIQQECSVPGCCMPGNDSLKCQAWWITCRHVDW
jgi:hypothetical protein